MSSLRSLTLQVKTNLAVMIILFLALGVNTGVLTYVSSSKYREALLDKSAAIGASLQAEVGRVLSFGLDLDSLDGMDEQLAELPKREGSLLFGRIVGADGAVLFHGDPAAKGTTVEEMPDLGAFEASPRLFRETERFFEVSLPLRDLDGKVVGLLQLGVSLEAVRGPLYHLLFLGLGISVASFLVSVVLMYVFINRVVTRRVLGMKEAAERIASGDLACQVEAVGGDELTLLGRSINEISSNLREMIGKARKITTGISTVVAEVGTSSADVLMVSESQKGAVEDTSRSLDQLDQSIASVSASANSLSESAEETSSAISQMVRSIGSVAQSAAGVNESAQNSAASIEEMAASINEIAGNLKVLSESSDAVSSSVAEVDTATKEIEQRATESVKLAEDVKSNAAGKGLAAITAAMEGMEEIRQSVTGLAETVNVLGKRSEEIGKIVKVINEITEQTNLLSLNAAILAAQAGEHGKGFSVVAENIGDLAEATSVSTKEISDLISSVQTETGASVRKASEGLAIVEKGIGLVHDVNNALKAITQSSTASSDMASAIQRATSEQTQVIRHISGSIQTMAAQIEQIAGALDEQNRGSRLIISATETMKEISDRVRTATGEQKEGSSYITRAVDNMARQVDQIVDATSNQKRESLSIVQAMESVKNATESLASSSQRMDDSIRSLQDEAQSLLGALEKFRI